MKLLQLLRELYHNLMDNKYIKILLLLAVFLILVGMSSSDTSEPHALAVDNLEVVNIPETFVSDALTFDRLTDDMHDSEEWMPQVPKLPNGITLDPNWHNVLNDPARTQPSPAPIKTVHITSITVPQVWGDEMRQPLPPRKIPSYRAASPDWRCDEWMETARAVGWEEEDLPKLSYVIYRESRCFPDRHNPDDPMGGSNGLMQINQFWCKPTQYWPNGWLQSHNILNHCDDLYDPTINLTAGLAIRQNSGWSPWGV